MPGQKGGSSRLMPGATCWRHQAGGTGWKEQRVHPKSLRSLVTDSRVHALGSCFHAESGSAGRGPEFLPFPSNLVRPVRERLSGRAGGLAFQLQGLPRAGLCLARLWGI